MLVTERKLAIISGICSVIGIVALFLIAAVAEPLQISASDVTKASIRGGDSSSNFKVEVTGFVDSVVVKENYAVVKVAAVEGIEAVSFDIGYIKGLGLGRFQEVEVFGELRQYKGKDSLIISRLRLINNSSISNISCAVD